MEERPEVVLPAALGAGRAVGYVAAPGASSVPLVLLPSPHGRPVRVEQWEGRHAVSLPAAALRGVHARLAAEAPWAVVHGLRELDEALGTLLIHGLGPSFATQTAWRPAW
ncbi:unnamed protein product [Prorocentrum cordatum]|uniref:Uncharacterized protein n=1 Tax=Prorocentrum cordatum TaxID=2364126 RepID=A0ABN9WNV0_9DINO|nr:unnamed protein product [Polarella glacialis]